MRNKSNRGWRSPRSLSLLLFRTFAGGSLYLLAAGSLYLLAAGSLYLFAGRAFFCSLYSTSAAVAFGDGKAQGKNTSALRPGRLSKAERSALQQGLLLTFSQREKTARVTDTRQARLAALHVPRGTAPTPFLKPGPFEATFDGYLKLKLRGRYTFRFKGSGSVVLNFNGVEVLKLHGDDLSKFKPADVALVKGYNRLRIRYTSPSKKSPSKKNPSQGRIFLRDATLRLYWSSDEFPIEPLPPSQLMCGGSKITDERFKKASELRLGRELFAVRGCAKCHIRTAETALEKVGMPELNQQAPSLEGVGSRLGEPWIARWIFDPSIMRNHIMMPNVLAHFDEPQREQAATDLAAYLSTLTSSKPSDAKEPQTELKKEGETLFETLGCIACHRFDRPDEPDEYDRVSLYYVGGKFKPGALSRFLRRPDRHAASTRMPDFLLDKKEADALAVYLRVQSKGKLTRIEAGKPADARRGMKLFTTLRCANCHLPKTDKPSKLSSPATRIERTALLPAQSFNLPALAQKPGDRGCLGKDSSAKGKAPDFGFDCQQREALKAFLATDRSSLGRRVFQEYSRRQIKALNCVACHSRDTRMSHLPYILDEEGTQGLQPPTIPNQTWTGEQLLPAWTEKFLSAKLNYRPRPWLKIRMPVFRGGAPWAAHALAIGLSMEHGFSPAEHEQPAQDAEMAKIGFRLTLKEQGFNCIDCHAAGSQPAKAVFESPGVNFAYAQERLRYEYFVRWLLHPQRIDPATKMPRLAPDSRKTALTNTLDGDARKQFNAIWHYFRTLKKQ